MIGGENRRATRPIVWMKDTPWARTIVGRISADHSSATLKDMLAKNRLAKAQTFIDGKVSIAELMRLRTPLKVVNAKELQRLPKRSRVRNTRK